MRKRSGLAAVWLGATIAATLVVWLAIRIVADDVSEPETAAASSDATTSTTPPDEPTSTSSTTATGVHADGSGTGRTTQTTTAGRPSSTPTTSGGPTPTTSTTAAPRATTTTTRPSTTTSTSTTTTTAASTSTTRTFNGVGGSATIRFSSGSVELVLATPANGFTTQVDDSGPDRVRVEFRSNDHTTRIEANAGDTTAQVTESGSGQG